MPLTDLLAAIRTATPYSKFILYSLPVLFLSFCILTAYLDRQIVVTLPEGFRPYQQELKLCLEFTYNSTVDIDLGPTL